MEQLIFSKLHIGHSDEKIGYRYWFQAYVL